MNSSADIRRVAIESFAEIRDRCSADVVIVDPSINQKFISSCMKRFSGFLPVELNLALLNVRKSNDLRGLPRSQRTIVRNQDDYRFASEIAARFMERRDQITLDRILCDPKMALEFDSVAARICPGFTPFEYRWAALNLRKTRGLKPEIGARLVRPDCCFSQKVSKVVIGGIPDKNGVYLFYNHLSTLYIGETDSLFKRIKRHLVHSDNKGLAHWIWEHGIDDLHLEYHVLPEGIKTRQRKALEAELIRCRRPIFNIAGIGNV